MLSSAGYRVDTVPDGAAAVQAVAAHPYDAVLMDCQMPELNGYEATAAIRAQEGSGQHTPIIAMTAGARREDRDRCLAVGMDSYRAKPVSKDALLALVARSVKKRPTQQFDEAVIAELESLEGDVLSDLLSLYFEEAAGQVSELSDAIGRGDAQAVGRTAHKLLGSSSTLGAAHVSRVVSELETAAKAGSLGAAGELVGRLRSALDDTRSAFRSREVSRLSPPEQRSGSR